MIDNTCPPTVKRLPGGVYYILVNTTRKWVPYDLNPLVPADGHVDISFTDETLEHRRGAPDLPPTESVFVDEAFKALDHVVTSRQEKDQITIICVPKGLVLATPPLRNADMERRP